MAKKIKKNTFAVKETNRNINGKKNNEKKQAMTGHNNKQNVTCVKNPNIKFKNKQTKGKLSRKMKQIYKNKETFTATNFLNSDITKVISIKNKGKHKVTEQVQNRKKEKLISQNQRQEKPDKESKISSQTKNKINTKKSVKKTKFKHTKLKVKQEQEQNEQTKKLSSVLQKKTKQKKNKFFNSSQKNDSDSHVAISNHNLDIKHLAKLLTNKQEEEKKQKAKAETQSLRQRMMTKLKASRFRYLNETLYNSESSESKKYFKNDPGAFKAYHEGYKHQVEQWPLNPLDIILSSIKKMPKTHIIADFGCGEAKLAAAVPQKVHSFDFVSLNENVTVCDVAHTPLLTNGVHAVVFCLSLMGTNLKDYIVEANRVLKKDGILKIAEVESRFEQVEDFIKAVTSYGFKCIWKDLSHNLFYFLDFIKEKDISSRRNKLPEIILKPCLYKKR